MEEFILSEKNKQTLLEIARKTIESVVLGHKYETPAIKDQNLNTRCGAFVTIHSGGRLRGCIGNIIGDAPLFKTVSMMAAEAALHDPRFAPVRAKELQDIDIEISVLTPLKKIDDIEEIEVGKHGILIKKGFYQGLLLPQVASEYGWDRIKFLENTCMKAGLPKGCYRQKDTEILIFSAIVFGEAC